MQIDIYIPWCTKKWSHLGRNRGWFFIKKPGIFKVVNSIGKLRGLGSCLHDPPFRGWLKWWKHPWVRGVGFCMTPRLQGTLKIQNPGVEKMMSTGNVFFFRVLISNAYWGNFPPEGGDVAAFHCFFFIGFAVMLEAPLKSLETYRMRDVEFCHFAVCFASKLRQFKI